MPEPKRRYGYFCLPVLWGDQLIGRVDAKADRKQKRLIIHLLQVEPQLKSERFPAQLLNQAIEEFALRHQCESWEVRRIEAEPPLSNLFSQG